MDRRARDFELKMADRSEKWPLFLLRDFRSNVCQWHLVDVITHVRLAYRHLAGILARAHERILRDKDRGSL